MKKLLAIAVFLMAFSNAFADLQKPNIFGTSFNVAVACLRGDDAPDIGDYDSYVSNLAFDAMIGINNRFGIHTGAGLTINKFSYINGDNDTGFGTHYAIDPDDDESFSMAIEIPAMGRFYVSRFFYLEAGATLGFNLFEEYYSGQTGEWNSVDEQNLLNVEIAGGLGFTLGFGLEFSLKYTHGLTDMYENADISMSRIFFGIGYWFNYRKTN